MFMAGKYYGLKCVYRQKLHWSDFRYPKVESNCQQLSFIGCIKSSWPTLSSEYYQIFIQLSCKILKMLTSLDILFFVKCAYMACLKINN